MRQRAELLPDELIDGLDRAIERLLRRGRDVQVERRIASGNGRVGDPRALGLHRRARVLLDLVLRRRLGEQVAIA